MREQIDTDTPEQFLKSKYNSAIAQLIRIDILWKAANINSRKGNLRGWNLDLDCVWRELCEDSNVKEKDELEFAMFNKRLLEAKFFEVHKQNGFKGISEETIGKSSIHYQILMDKEIWLRRLQHKLGKGSVYEDSIDDYMD